VPDPEITTLVVTALLTSVVHTLIPDHWLPFVLIGRARDWSAATAAVVSGGAALLHTGLSVGLGLAALGIGLASAEVLGETLERAAPLLLIGFGLVYLVWAWRKGGHFHPGGALLHRDEPAEGCDGSEGPGHPEHLHYHADDNLIRGRTSLGAVTLALIVGANPCVLVLPILLVAARQGVGTVLLVGAAYAVPTIALMVGLSVGGVMATRRIQLPAVARHMEALSGLLIASAGVAFWLVHA
jgi:ABC-type nickel/cobalt efflux system permease component RcnA